MSEQRTPHRDLPTDPQTFYAAGADLTVLDDSPPREEPPALERLGPPPFPKGRFPFIGFLATVYDHLATHAKARVG